MPNFQKIPDFGHIDVTKYMSVSAHMPDLEHIPNIEQKRFAVSTFDAEEDLLLNDNMIPVKYQISSKYQNRHTRPTY